MTSAAAGFCEKLPTPRQTIGMDLTAPFWVYIDGDPIRLYPTLQEAAADYEKLRAELVSSVEAT